jgi:hypothetical protein
MSIWTYIIFMNLIPYRKTIIIRTKPKFTRKWFTCNGKFGFIMVMGRKCILDNPCHWRDRNVLEETETKCVCWIFLPNLLYVLSQECLHVLNLFKRIMWYTNTNCHIFLLNKVINCHNFYLYGKKYLTCFMVFIHFFFVESKIECDTKILQREKRKVRRF